MISKKTKIQGNSEMLRMVRAQQAETPSYQHKTPPLETFVVERDHDLPIQFTGYRVGHGQSNHHKEAPHGTSVEIFVTRSGKIVTAVHQWQREKDRERFAAAAHSKPEDALEWLKEDGGGYLGKASREAWDDACDNHLPLQGQNVEIID